MIDSLLSRMTLEEKIGQLTQLAVSALVASDSPLHGTVTLDDGKLHEAIVLRHVGSILNLHHGALTLHGWRRLVREIQEVALEKTRLPIPIVYGIDAIHGANYTLGGTIFPHNIGLAAAFDADLVREAARVTAAETWAAGQLWNFAPVLDVARHPAWPRFYETFGEDTCTVTALGRAAVEGMQESGLIAATAKHFLAYGAPVTGRDRTPASLTRRAVREQILPPFREAISAGVMAVMVNSGEIDGEPIHASRYWLTDVLRDELGFEGVVVSDWADISFLHTRHRVAATMKDAVRLALEAGIDVSMTPDSYDFIDALLALVEEGFVSVCRIDESVRRVLTMKARLGLFGFPYPSNEGEVGSAQAGALALRAARESVTLLKNDGALPLRHDARVLVAGPAADSLTALNGGWTYTWQGSESAPLKGAATLLDAIRARTPHVEHVNGASFVTPYATERATSMARGSDVAIVVLGEDAYAEWVGDVEDLSLPTAQLQLAEEIAATGTPTVLVLLEGRPRLISRIADRMSAIVLGYLPGGAGARAIAEALFGEINPSGRLPFTYPRHPNALIPYDHKHTEALNAELVRGPGGFDPQFEFGHGLSYTSFAYHDLSLGSNQVTFAGELHVTVHVENTGARAGDEAVLLFTRQHFASLTPAVRKLRAFHKVRLAPGESRVVEFCIPCHELAFVGHDGAATLEPGCFDVLVGPLTRTFELVPSAVQQEVHA